MPTCCPLITHHRYNLDLIVRFSQRSRIARSFSPLQTKRPLFSRTYSLKSDPAQYGRVTAEKKGFQGQSGDCSSERDARLGSSIKNQPRGHYRRDERTRGGLTTGRRALPGSVLTRSSSSFFPLRSSAAMSEARALSEHQHLFHCDTTDAMACEITMSEAGGAGLGLPLPTRLGNKQSSVHVQHSDTRTRRLLRADHPGALPKMRGAIPLPFY